MPEEARAVQFAQQVAEYVILQRRTDGLGGVHRFRLVPCACKVKSTTPEKEVGFLRGWTIAFDTGMRVLVGISTLTGAISQCGLFAKPHVFEHGEWVQEDGDPTSCFIPGAEIHQFREALQEKSGRKYEFGRTRC